MNEETFLSALHEAPNDNVTWLALADWLQEDGQGQRAELVRLVRQLRDLPVMRRLKKRAALKKRVAELLNAGVAPVVPEITNSLGMRLALIPPGHVRTAGGVVAAPAGAGRPRNSAVTFWDFVSPWSQIPPLPLSPPHPPLPQRGEGEIEQKTKPLAGAAGRVLAPPRPFVGEGAGGVRVRCIMRTFLATLLVPLTMLAATAGTIDTVAGTGEKGYSRNGRAATKAKPTEPFHCELDGKGALFVAEAMNHCVRKVDLKAGTITTVAGTGKKGFSGDGGLATKATFNEPYSAVVSPQGDLYVVDRLNLRVRKVDGKSGVVTTVAGNGKEGGSGGGGA